MSSNAEESICLLDADEPNIDMSEWMTNLSAHIVENVPINQLAIPGSHDSGAFWLDPTTPLAPGKYFSLLSLATL